VENFEALQNIDNFCKVLVKKTVPEKSEGGSWRNTELSEKDVFEEDSFNRGSRANSSGDYNMQPEFEEPLIDVFDEEDHIRILVQCRCQEQQVTFYPSTDGIKICREEYNSEKDIRGVCNDVCRKLSLRTDGLQLENMQFIIAKCNNNNTLEALIPKIRQ
jgi:hypothetical protein